MSDCIMKRSGSIEDEAATKRAKVEDTADTTSTQDKQAVDTNTTLDTKDISDQSSRAATTDKDTSLETPQIASDSVIVDGVEGGISTEHTDETPYEGKYFRDIRKESHMSEAMAGIEAFTTPGTPFHCILKHRYSDFVVNEIDPDGNVVHLTSLECHLDLEEQDKAQEKQQEDVKIAEQPADADFFDTLSGVLDAGWITKVKEYLTNSLNEDDIPNKEALRINTEDSSAAEFGARALVFPYEDSKDKRTRLHQFVKTHFATTHRTDTVANADKKTCVRIVKGRNQDKRRPRKTENKFLEFVLYKEARDTMSSVSIIGKTLNARPHIFSYAGVKDKRAITTQRMRIKGREAQNTFRANSRLTGMFLGNMKYADTPLGLGDLQGNRFTVVLRELSGIEDEDITTRIEAIKQKGFLNYFGLQRFGSRCPTHHIGMAVLKNEWEKAIKLVLSSLSEEDQVKCQNHLRHSPKDFRGAADRLGFRCHIEKNLLNCLHKYHGDPKQAFQGIERKTRTLYVHSVQSYVWNKAVTKRQALYGDQVVEGDLVNVPEGEGDEGSKVLVHQHDSKRARVHLVTAEDVAANKFSMDQVVLPMPGYAVFYPTNEVGEYMQTLLKETGMAETGALNPAMKNQKNSLPGGYRNMVIYPRDMSVRVVYYDDADEQITYTDYEKLEGKPAPVLKTKGEAPRRAAILEFSLQCASYATMLFRELTKSDSGSTAQAALTQTVKDKDAEIASQTTDIEPVETTSV